MSVCSHPHLQTCQTLRPKSSFIEPPVCSAQPARDGSRVWAAVLRRWLLQEARQAQAGSVTSCRATRCTSETACPAGVRKGLLHNSYSVKRCWIYHAEPAEPDLPDAYSNLGNSRSMAARLSSCMACSNASISGAGQTG